jgi:hypothetical protein
MKRILTYILCFFLLSLFVSCNPKRALVVGKIQKASKLATAEFKVDKLVFGVKNKRVLWVIKLNEAQFLAKSQATIKTGINLDKLKEEDIKIHQNSISITLPAVQVINFSYPAESFKKIELLSSETFSSKINLEDQENFFQEAEMDIRNNLKYMGVIETTQQKTRILLEAMLRNLGYTEIYIDFKEGKLIPEVEELLELTKS